MSVMAPELSQKRLELLKEAVPNLQRVTVLSNPGNPAVTLALQETQTAAQALGLAIQSVDVREPSEIGLALSTIAREPPGALVLLIDTMIHRHRVPIVAFPKSSEISPLFKAEVATVSFDAAKAGKLSRDFQDCEQIGSFEKSVIRGALGAARYRRERRD
jgi:ABC-type uncharacterized transport system substrate-binding protein